MTVNCIIKNTKILQQLEVMVGFIADDFILKDIVPTPKNIFNEVVKLGVEVDLSTIGAIYAKNLSGTDATFMSVKEVCGWPKASYTSFVKSARSFSSS